MTTNAMKFNELALETLTELAKEAFDECSSVFQVIVDNENRLANFGRILAACREKVPAGKWTEWLQQTFSGRLPLRTAQRWIVEAVDPEKAEANREKDREAKAKKAKATSDAPDLAPGVKVIEPSLKAEPKTNTKHTAENRKANPAEQPATRPVNVQAELVSTVDDEQSGDSGQSQIAQELLQVVEKAQGGRNLIDVLGEEDPATLLESCFRHNPVTAIVRFLINSTVEKDVEDVAKQLRKAADMLDPPKKPAKAGAVPTAAELHEAIPGDFPGDLYETCRQWATYKQGRAKGERIQSQDAWKIALKQIWNHAEANGVDVVIEMIEKAIANSWKGWNHGSGQNGTGTTSGKTAAASATQRREQANASAFDHIRRAAAAQRASGSDQG